MLSQSGNRNIKYPREAPTTKHKIVFIRGSGKALYAVAPTHNFSSIVFNYRMQCINPQSAFVEFGTTLRLGLLFSGLTFVHF